MTKMTKNDDKLSITDDDFFLQVLQERVTETWRRKDGTYRFPESRQAYETRYGAGIASVGDYDGQSFRYHAAFRLLISALEVHPDFENDRDWFIFNWPHHGEELMIRYFDDDNRTQPSDIAEWILRGEGAGYVPNGFGNIEPDHNDVHQEVYDEIVREELSWQLPDIWLRAGIDVDDFVGDLVFPNDHYYPAIGFQLPNWQKLFDTLYENNWYTVSNLTKECYWGGGGYNEPSNDLQLGVAFALCGMFDDNQFVKETRDYKDLLSQCHFTSKTDAKAIRDIFLADFVIQCVNLKEYGFEKVISVIDDAAESLDKAYGILGDSRVFIFSNIAESTNETAVDRSITRIWDQAVRYHSYICLLDELFGKDEK